MLLGRSVSAFFGSVPSLVPTDNKNTSTWTTSASFRCAHTRKMVTAVLLLWRYPYTPGMPLMMPQTKGGVDNTVILATTDPETSRLLVPVTSTPASQNHKTGVYAVYRCSETTPRMPTRGLSPALRQLAGTTVTAPSTPTAVPISCRKMCVTYQGTSPYDLG